MTNKPAPRVITPKGEIGYIRSLRVRDPQGRVMAEVVIDTDGKNCHDVRIVYPEQLKEVQP